MADKAIITAMADCTYDGTNYSLVVAVTYTQGPNGTSISYTITVVSPDFTPQPSWRAAIAAEIKRSARDDLVISTIIDEVLFPDMTKLAV